MRPTSEAASTGHQCGHDGLTGGDDTSVWSPPSASGLTVVDHDGQAKMAIRPPLVD